MDTRRYANPNCPLCQGHPGRVKTGPGINDWAVCPCAILGQRIEAAKLRLKKALPERALQMTFAKFQTGGDPHNERALMVAQNFVDNWPKATKEGWALGFYGMPGAGKTHLAVAIAQAVTKRFNVTPQLMNLPKALRMERERFNNPSLPSPLLEAQKADLLILDDLGAEYERQGDDPSRVSWLTEQLYTLLDERFMQNRPLIYTTNLSPSDMERRYDNEAWHRVWSRLERAQVTEKPLQVVPVPGVRATRSDAEALLHAARD